MSRWLSHWWYGHFWTWGYYGGPVYGLWGFGLITVVLNTETGRWGMMLNTD